MEFALIIAKNGEKGQFFAGNGDYIGVFS